MRTGNGRSFGISEIQEDVLARRLGSSSETLDQVARTWGLTRERIRQIQNQSLDIIRASDSYRRIHQRARSKLEVSGYLTRETAAACAREVSPSMEIGLSRAIGSILILNINGFQAKDCYLDMIIRDRQISHAIGDIQRIVDREIMRTPDCTAEQVAAMIAGRPEYAQVSDWVRGTVVDLWAALRSSAWKKLDDRRRHATAADLACEVLKEVGQPLHWSMIAQEVNRRRARLDLRPLSENATHNRLQDRDDLFSYTDQGTYGLREWGAAVPYIRVLIVQILETAGVTLTRGEIANEARKIRSIKDSSLTMYLDMHPDFYRARSGKYGLRTWLDPHPTIRTSRDYVESPGDRQKRLKSSFARR